MYVSVCIYMYHGIILSSLISARNDFITAIYIIFLGVVPMLALSSIGVWYVRNSGQHWKKGALSTYVFSVDRLKQKRKTHAFASRDIRVPQLNCTAGKEIYEKAIGFFTTRQRDSEDSKRIFVITNNFPSKEKLQITKTDLISTTNPDAINCSDKIDFDKSIPPCRVEIVNRKNDSTVDKPLITINLRNDPQEKKSVPVRTEMGSRIAERIHQLQKRQSRNVKNLTVNTDLKFDNLYDNSCETTADVTPKSSSVMLPERKDTLKSPMPFYNKKPPPPPAPAQSLKPKV